jgi:protein N-terminal amidase
MKGYNFASPSAILPYLESPHAGPTSVFCRELAQRLHCHVVAGYPESLNEECPTAPDGTRLGNPTDDESSLGFITPLEIDEERLVGANSAMVYSPKGRLVLNYRKTNLYEADITWAVPGSGFAMFELPVRSQLRDDETRLPSSSLPETSLPTDGASLMTEASNPEVTSSGRSNHRHNGLEQPRIVRVALGICMDLNPSIQHPSPSPPGPVSSVSRKRTHIWTPNSWSSTNGPFELADYCLEHEVNVLVMVNAWLDSGVVDASGSEEPENLEADFHTLNYWANRLRPLWARQQLEADSGEARDGKAAESSASSSDGELDLRRSIIVMCNRIGEEKGKPFAGSSAMLEMIRQSDRPRLLDCMGRQEEGMRLWTVMV